MFPRGNIGTAVAEYCTAELLIPAVRGHPRRFSSTQVCLWTWGCSTTAVLEELGELPRSKGGQAVVGVSGSSVPVGSGCWKWSCLEFMESGLLDAELSLKSERERGVGLRGSWRVAHWGTSPCLSFLSWGHLTELVENKLWVEEESWVEDERWVEDECWVEDELWVEDTSFGLKMSVGLKMSFGLKPNFVFHRNTAGGWGKPFICPQYLTSPRQSQQTLTLALCFPPQMPARRLMP